MGETLGVYQAEGAAQAIRYLVDHGVRMINFSGGLRRSMCPSAPTWERLQAVFAYAADQNVVIVLAAGNDAGQYDDYPGDAKTVIVAGATLLNDERWQQTAELRGMKTTTDRASAAG